MQHVQQLSQRFESRFFVNFSGVAREEGKWRHAPWGAGLGGATAHILQSAFKQKFRPKYA